MRWMSDPLRCPPSTKLPRRRAYRHANSSHLLLMCSSLPDTRIEPGGSGSQVTTRQHWTRRTVPRQRQRRSRSFWQNRNSIDSEVRKTRLSSNDTTIFATETPIQPKHYQTTIGVQLPNYGQSRTDTLP